MPPPESSYRQLWRDGDVQQTTAALTALAAARQVPKDPQQVQLLLGIVQQQASAPDAAILPTLTLLTRWARQQALQRAAARDAALLRSVAAAGQRLVQPDTNQPRLAAACLLLLASVAAATPDPEMVDGLAEAVGSALLGPQLGAPEPTTAAEAMAAVGTLLPCLMGKPVAACWLLAALLRWLGGCAPGTGPACLALDCLAPSYSMLRGVAMAALSRFAPPVAVSGLLRPAYLVLRGAAADSSLPGQPPEQPAQAAAAVLALGGLAEALLRSAPGFAEATQLAAEAEGSLAAACDTADAAAAAAVVVGSLPDLELLRDACSLAGAQLFAAVRRTQQPVASPAMVRCQTQSLLHCVLSLAPLLQAAQAQAPPAQANEQLRRQVICALAQHTASLASGLAAQLPKLDDGMQRWLLQQVAAAGRQAYQHYRQLSLAAPPGWLASIDAGALRQLLERLFLACLALLAAAWEGTAVAPAAAAGGRAQLAATVVCVLADLQFCRLVSVQYAALLRAVLVDVPDDAAAAATLASCLPCYAELTAACPARGGSAAWLVDSMAVAKVQFLMNALVPCCGMLPQVVLEERLAPLAFLCLLHPHSPTATAAHQLFCGLIVAVAQERREPLAAYYVRRSLEGCPGATPLQQFGQGLATLLQELPLGSPVALLCLQQVLDKCEELAARGDPAAADLAGLAAQHLLLVDHWLLDGAMAACNRLLQPCSAAAERPGAAAAAAALRSAAVGVVRQTDDCLRKPVLARWLLEEADG